MKKEADVLSEEVNSAVVQLPGRRFPGVVIQGDTLKSWVDLVAEVGRALERRDWNGASDSLHYLQEKIRTHLGVYERVLETQGLPLPYSREPET